MNTKTRSCRQKTGRSWLRVCDPSCALGHSLPVMIKKHDRCSPNSNITSAWKCIADFRVRRSPNGARLRDVDAPRQTGKWRSLLEQRPFRSLLLPLPSHRGKVAGWPVTGTARDGRSQVDRCLFAVVHCPLVPGSSRVSQLPTRASNAMLFGKRRTKSMRARFLSPGKCGAPRHIAARS